MSMYVCQLADSMAFCVFQSYPYARLDVMHDEKNKLSGLLVLFVI
jgi:hypothetical protein